MIHRDYSGIKLEWQKRREIISEITLYRKRRTHLARLLGYIPTRSGRPPSANNLNREKINEEIDFISDEISAAIKFIDQGRWKTYASWCIMRNENYGSEWLSLLRRTPKENLCQS